MREQNREYLILMALTGLIGALSIGMNAGTGAGGNIPALGRTALGVLGLAAAIEMWRQPRMGWLLGLIWSVIQIPVVAWSIDGSPTQQVLSIPVISLSQTVVNGHGTSYSQIGINLVGVILTAWFKARRSLFDPRDVGREAQAVGRFTPPPLPHVW